MAAPMEKRLTCW